MLKTREGFTLIELMIVVAVIAVVAAIAIPSLLAARKSTNEAVAISSLRTLSTVNEQYKTRFRTYAGSLANMAAVNYIDSNLGSGSKSGYDFTYGGGSNTWSCNADPSTPAETGDRYFFINQTGVIRFTSAAPATMASPPIQ